MGPKATTPSGNQPPRPRLDEQIDLGHPLARLVALIDWQEIERSFGAHWPPSAVAQRCRRAWWPSRLRRRT
jgi:IS5 family transposase